MDRALEHPTRLWLVLVGMTCATWWLGADHGLGAGSAAFACVLAIAFTKAWLVGRNFMELGSAPPILRGLFHLWITCVGVGLVTFYLVT